MEIYAFNKKREYLILIIKIFANFLGIDLTISSCASNSIHNQFCALFKDWTSIFSILLYKRDFGSHITYLSVDMCSHVNVHVCVGKFLYTLHSVKCHTNPRTTLFSQFFTSQRVFTRMSVVEVSSPAHECWMKRERDIGFPTAQGTFLKPISPPEGAECLNYLDLNCSDGDKI